MKQGLAVKLALVFSVLSAQVLSQETVLTVPAGSELTLKPLMDQRITETTEVSLQPQLASEDLTWPENCLLSLTITPGAEAGFEPGKMVCITAERQIIEAVPVGEVVLGQCASGEGTDCASIELSTEQSGTLRLDEALQMTLQPRNVF